LKVAKREQWTKSGHLFVKDGIYTIEMELNILIQRMDKNFEKA